MMWYAQSLNMHSHLYQKIEDKFCLHSYYVQDCVIMYSSYDNIYSLVLF